MIDHNRPAVSPVPIIFLIIMNAFISSSFVFWLTLALTQLWGGGGSGSVGAALLLGQGQGGGWRYHERFLHSAPTTPPPPPPILLNKALVKVFSHPASHH